MKSVPFFMIPEFFKWYDIQFNPQDTILTLDYPVLKDLSQYTGVDRVYEYLKCIQQEQNFLRQFAESDVIGALFRHNRGYRDMIENLCEIFISGLCGGTSSEQGRQSRPV